MGLDHTHMPAKMTAPDDKAYSVERALWIAFLLNFGFLIVEVLAGILTNSLVLLSDAGHMVSDVAALALALFTERLVKHKPAGSFTFGLRRAPVLGAFGNALTLYIIVVLIFWEAWDRLIHPPVISALPVLIIGCLGLAINGISAYVLSKSHSGSLNVKGAMLHLFADALGSLGAILAALVMIVKNWTLADPIISIFIGSIILLGTWPLLKDSIKVLLQAAPSSISPEQVRHFLLEQPAIAQIDDLHIWELNTGDIIFSANLVASERACSLKKIEQINQTLRQELVSRFGIHHATFEWRTDEGMPQGCEDH